MVGGIGKIKADMFYRNANTDDFVKSLAACWIASKMSSRYRRKSLGIGHLTGNDGLEAEL